MGKGLMQMFRRRGRSTDMEDYYARQEKRGFVGSRQKVSSVPMAPPVGYKKQPSMVDIIREQVRSHHLAVAAEQAGMETFEEADDFDVGDPDDALPLSEYEAIFEPPAEAVSSERPEAAPTPPEPPPPAPGPSEGS